MRLLYCLNGAVVGWHDSAQNVPASSYGTGVRVVPYAADIGLLPKFGPAPPAGTKDTRPYAQPVETPEILKAYAAQLRWETSTQGITYNAIPANTDGLSQTLVGNLAQYAATVTPTTAIDFTQDGVHYQITAQDALNMNGQMNSLIQQSRTIEAQCLADLSLATPTILTYADVEARFAGVRKRK